MRIAALVIGAVLLLFGVLITAGVIDFQEEDKVVDIGALEVSKTEHHKPPVNAGYVLLVLGGISLAVGVLARR